MSKLSRKVAIVIICEGIISETNKTNLAAIQTRHLEGYSVDDSVMCGLVQWMDEGSLQFIEAIFSDLSQL